METNDKIIKNKKGSLAYIKVIVALIVLLLIIISIITYSSYQAKQLNKLTNNVTQNINKIIVSTSSAGNLISAVKLTNSERNGYISQLNSVIENFKNDENSKYNTQALHIQEQNNIALATYFRDEYIIARNLSPLLKILNTYSTTSLPSANDIYNIEATTKSVLNSNQLAEMSNLYNNNNYIQQQLMNYTTPSQIKNSLNTQLSAAQALASIENISQ